MDKANTKARLTRAAAAVVIERAGTQSTSQDTLCLEHQRSDNISKGVQRDGWSSSDNKR